MNQIIRITGLAPRDLNDLDFGPNDRMGTAVMSTNGYVIAAGDIASMRLVDGGIEFEVKRRLPPVAPLVDTGPVIDATFVPDTTNG